MPVENWQIGLESNKSVNTCADVERLESGRMWRKLKLRGYYLLLVIGCVGFTLLTGESHLLYELFAKNPAAS